MKKLFFALTTIGCLQATAQNNLNIVPAPAEIKMSGSGGTFEINKNTSIVLAAPKLEKTAALLNDYLQNTIGYSLKIVAGSNLQNAIVLNMEKLNYTLPGAYRMEIDYKGIYITGDNETGLFYGIQTLLQLLPLPKDKEASKLQNDRFPIPQLSMLDYPRFAYRGMHLDVARHFFPIAFIKKYIDYLAAYKYNTFHWHLTDDQGWRIEIKKYPLLTQVGSIRNGTVIGRYPGKGNDSLRYGGFYTQEQIKEIIQYAANRHIDVIPEIEMPGHASAAIAAYPQLSCFPMEDTKILPSTPWAGSRKGKQVQQTWGIFEDVFCPSEFSFQFLENVLTEVIALFPSKYIHIGGDECPKEAWKRSAFCQKLIKDKKLKDEHGLQSYFIQRIEKYINSKGKKIIGWDEILEGGLAPNATVMSWRGEDGGIQAAQQNHEVIMTPGTYCYLDHSQSKNEDSITIGGYLPLEKVYGYEPIPALLKEDQAKHIWGAQGNVWAEYIKNSNKVEYMIFPRMMALSEVLWSPKKNRNWKDFERRLPGIYQRLDAAKINYSKAYYDLKATVLPTDNADGLLWKVESTTNNAIRIQLNQQDSIFTYQNPVFINDLVFLSSASNEKTTITQKFSFNKATGKKITLINEPNKSYPGDGAFTLVNGIQNEKGLAKGTEFLGFLGKDLEATIDLKTTSNIHKVTLHTLDQNGSWIYLPQQVEITYIPDIDYTEDQLKNFPKEIKTIDPIHDKGLSTITIESKQSCRYIKLLAKNVGTITEGNPGAGNPAWLFADEIEIE